MKLENECFAVDLAVNMTSQNDLLTLALTKQLLNIGIMKNKDNKGEGRGKIRFPRACGERARSGCGNALPLWQPLSVLSMLRYNLHHIVKL